MFKDKDFEAFMTAIKREERILRALRRIRDQKHGNSYKPPTTPIPARGSEYM